MKAVIVRHPQFPHMTRTVARREARRWVAQGWIRQEDPADNETPTGDTEKES